MPYLVLDPATAEPAPTVTFGAPLTSEGWTLDKFLSELTVLLGGRTDIDPARMTQWINDSYVDLATSLDLLELRTSFGLTTVADQPLYLLPKAVRATLGADVIDETSYPNDGGFPLEKKSLDWYRAQRLLSGQPQGYFVYGGMLVVYPTPSAAGSLAVECWIRPEPLVNDDDSPILPLEWHRAILLGARANAHKGLLEWNEGAAAENDFVNYVRRRSDLKADEDTGRIPLSSVPRSRKGTTFPTRNLRDKPYNLDLD